jgi:polysaccharide biosynthesis transport protein
LDLRSLLDVARRRAWLLLLAGVLAGATSYYFSNQLTPIYRATTTILVNQSQAPGSVLYNDVLASERLTSTYAELVPRRPMLTQVRDKLSLPIDEDELSRRVSVRPIRDTQLLRIAVDHEDPAFAALIANTLADVFIADNAQQLGSRPGTVSIAEVAEEPSSPSSPNVRLNTILASILGLMLGGAAIFLLEYFDDTVKSPEDIEKATGLITLGTVTRFKGSRSHDDRIWAEATLNPATSEDYRQIRTNIHFSLLGKKTKSILVTSSSPSEGKSTTAANLATVLAQAGSSVILVDSDLRRPTLHKDLKTANSFGLTGLLLSEMETPNTALLSTSTKGLRLLPSGPLPPNPSEILMAPAFNTLVARLKDTADYVIFDSPPLLAVTDARLLARQVDATILVVEVGKVRTEISKRSYDSLAQADGRIMGVVLNKVTARRRGYYYGYYDRHLSSGDGTVADNDPEASEEVQRAI